MIIFSKDGIILSRIRGFNGTELPSKDQCANNNNLSEEEIDVYFVKDDDVEIKETDTINTISGLNKKIKQGKSLETYAERKARAAELGQDS